MRSQMPLVEGAVWNMHQNGVIHGDLSESNIMWTKSHSIVFIDLSHAKPIDRRTLPNQIADDLESIRRIYERLVRSLFRNDTRS